MTTYVDDAAFTKLFRRRRANHARIVTELAKIVRGMSALYGRRFRSEHDLEDATSAVLIRCVEQIPKFDPTRGSGFAFFSRVTDTGLMNEVERLANRRKRRESPLVDGM
jgi:DNA-directed RNA polymerase specialized sigma24 family protein